MSKHKPKIMIVSPIENDPQSIILFEEILNKGGNPVLLPFKLYEKEKNHSFGFNFRELFFNEEIINLKAVFIRGVSVDTPITSPAWQSDFEMNIWRAKYIKENYKIFAISSILKELENQGVLVVNGLAKYLYHNMKSGFFSYLRSKGISVPDSMGTNSLSEALNFKNRYEKIVAKSPSGVGATKLIKNFKGVADKSLKYTPPMFQQEIKGQTIRIHTVGNKVVLALKIIASDIDSRTDTKGFSYYKMKKEHSDEVLRANSLLNLKFSAWDAIIGEDDKIYLLDCNPGPYIYWIGSYFTRLVKSELARYLVAFAESGDEEIAEGSISVPECKIHRIMKIEEKHRYVLYNGELNQQLSPEYRQRY